MTPRTSEQNEEIRQITQQKILKAAFPLFAEKGYANTSISEIANNAGVSKGLIYHYFDNKEEMLQQIFQYWIDEAATMFDFSDELSPEQKMEQMLSIVFEFTRQKPNVSRFIMALALQSDALKALGPYLGKMLKQQFDVMIDLMDELGYEKPVEEAYYLGAQLDGLSFGYLTMGEKYPWEAMTNIIMKRYVPL